MSAGPKNCRLASQITTSDATAKPAIETAAATMASDLDGATSSLSLADRGGRGKSRERRSAQVPR